MSNQIKSKKPVFGAMQTKNTLNAENSAPPLYIEAQNRKPEFDISEQWQHAKTNLFFGNSQIVNSQIVT